MMSMSACTSESQEKTRSTEASATIGSERPSLTWNSMFFASAKRVLQCSMHFSARSTRINRSARSLRYCVHLPKPGAISRMVPAGTYAWMRGSRAPYQSAGVPPHQVDHSSPDVDQSQDSLKTSFNVRISPISGTLLGGNVLPNLIVIGAAKCGTTSLHEYLALHPDIAMSAKKELNFFTRDDWRSQVDWYADQFPDAAVRGESSPGYTLAPFLPSVAGRVHELVPDARLVYLVRDPVDRAVANYTELVMHRLEERPIDHALTDFSDAANPHLCGSRYGSQVERFLRHFDRDRLLVLDQADLLGDRRPPLRRGFVLLAVDPDFDSPDFDRTHNTRGSKVRYNDLGMWLVRRGWFTERRGSVRGPLAQPLRTLLSRPIDDRLSRDARNALTAELRPEIEKLRRLTGFEPQGWSV